MTAPYALPPAALPERPGEDSSFDVRAVIGFLRRRAPLIAAIVFLINVAALLIVLQLTPVYEADSLVIVDPRQNDIFDPNSQASLLPPDVAKVASEVEIIQSPAVLVEVIRKLNLTLDKEFGPQTSILDWIRNAAGSPRQLSAEEILQATLKRLSDAVTIERRRATYVIAVSVRSEDAEKAARVSNEIATTHIDLQVNSKVALASGIQRALQAQLGQASEALQRSEQRIDSFIEQNIGRIGDPATRQELDDLMRQIEATRQAQAKLRTVAEQSRALLSSGAWDDLTAELDMQSLRERNRERTELANALAESEQGGNEAIDLRRRLSDVEQELASEAGRALTGMETDIATSSESEQRLRERLRQRITSGDLPRDLLVSLYEIQQETDVSRQLYQTLLNRAMSVDTQRDLQMADSRVVSPALPPGEAAFPRKKVILGLSAMASLLLGLGIAFLRENYIGGFTDETQVTAVLGAPFVAAVPKIPESSSSTIEVAAAEVVLHPVSIYSEAIRRIRLGLDIGARSGGRGGRVIVVASSLPGEGKTQTAISLSRSLSLSGKSVLLIDGDLRRPNVHRLMGITAGTSLEACLGDAPDVVEQAIMRDPLTDTRVILGAGGLTSADDVLFQRESFKRFLNEAIDRFDFVVVDTSPLLPVVDARLLLPHAQAIVFVLRWASTRQRDARTAIDDLAGLNGGRLPPMVIALNFVEGTRAAYGYAYQNAYSG